MRFFLRLCARSSGCRRPTNNDGGRQTVWCQLFFEQFRNAYSGTAPRVSLREVGMICKMAGRTDGQGLPVKSVCQPASHKLEWVAHTLTLSSRAPASMLFVTSVACRACRPCVAGILESEAEGLCRKEPHGLARSRLMINRVALSQDSIRKACQTTLIPGLRCVTLAILPTSCCSCHPFSLLCLHPIVVLSTVQESGVRSMDAGKRSFMYDVDSLGHRPRELTQSSSYEQGIAGQCSSL